MSLVEKEMYLLGKCSGIDLKRNESREILLRNLINMFWTLKACIVPVDLCVF